LRKKRSTQLLRECWSFLKKLMTCQNLQNKLLNITVLFIWYLLASLKKCHSPNMVSSISFWRVLVSVHSPFWRVFEKNGFPHWSSTNKIPSSSQWKLTCSRHVILIAEKLPSWHETTITHSLFWSWISFKNCSLALNWMSHHNLVFTLTQLDSDKWKLWKNLNK
jgi:hypothetical protein